MAVTGNWHWNSSAGNWLGCAALAMSLVLSAAGCSPAPPLTQTGFLSSYSRLEEKSSGKWSFVSPELKKYKTCMIDQIQIRAIGNSLSQDERVEITAYFRQALIKMLSRNGFQLVETPMYGTARIRVAITNVTESDPYRKVHPASNLAGAGRAGATMEGEIIDAVTGRQLAAVVQAGVGSQFTLMNFTTVSDIKSTIDEWASQTGNRLEEARRGNK
jgi:hypothetical protein